MEDEIDLELGEHALENPLVGDRSRELAAHLARQCRLERCDIDGDDRSSRLREAIDEAVPYFPARPRHEHGRSAHLAILYFRWFVGRGCGVRTVEPEPLRPVMIRLPIDHRPLDLV